MRRDPIRSRGTIRQVRRGLFNVLAALSLVLCVATVGLWVRSRWIDDRWRLPGPVGSYSAVRSCEGKLEIAWRLRRTRMPMSGWATPQHDSFWWVEDTAVPEGSDHLHAAGSDDIQVFPLSRTIWFGPVLFLRHFTAVVVFSFLPLAWCVMRLQRFGRKGRRLAGQVRCPRCGYDLRATPDRCPECGTSAAGGLRRAQSSRAG
jgi:hypothetical protein